PGRGGRVRRDPGLFRLHAHGPGGDERSGRATANTSRAGGALAFTFIDPHFEPWPETYRGNNLKWRLERVRETNPAVDLNDLLERSRGAAWCALVDGAKLYVDDDGVRDDGAQTCMTYNVYY